MENKQWKYPNTVKTARREIWAAITKGGGSGATVAIMEQGQLVYSEGLGVADREDNRPVDAATRFDIASVSKIFSTTAVMKLQDMGLVDIDQPVCRYITDFQTADPRYKDITVRMLFNHSSGLLGSCYNQAFCQEPHPNYQAFVLDAMRRSNLKHAPGEKSSYCNDGFTLCEIIVERVSGKPYIDFLREHVLEPLGLKDTGVSVGMAGAVDAAELYDDATGNKSLREVSPGVGMGGMSSTASDLCRFGQGFCREAAVRVLSPEGLKVMLTPQPSRFCDKLRTRQEDCHMGWDVNGMEKYEKHGVYVLMKGGLTWYATKFIVLPELNVSIALSFSGSGPSTKPALAILDAFLEEKGYGSMKNPVKAVPLPEPIPVELKRFAGFYSNGGVAVQISFSAPDAITIKPVTSEDAAVNFIYNKNYFYKKDDPVPYYFAEDGDMTFFVAENEHCADLVYQKLPYQNAPKALDFDIDGKVWLNMNIDLNQGNWNGMFAVKSSLCKDLPGYAAFAGVKLIEDGRYASPAGTYFRDQNELSLTEEDGVLTAYLYDYVMRREEDAAEALETGAQSVRVPETGYGTVWRKAAQDCILTITAEPGVIFFALGSDCKKFIYSNRFQEGEFFVPKGSYIAFYGKRGGTADINARS